MTNSKLFRLFLPVTLGSFLLAAAPVPRRISSKVIDLGKVTPIYMVAGMASLIEVPGAVTGIRTGNPASVQYFRPDKPENEVTVVLQNQQAKPTNLIIRVGAKKYVFDIVPSKTVHQDTLEVIGDFGGAEIEDSSAELLESSESASAGANESNDASTKMAGAKGGTP